MKKLICISISLIVLFFVIVVIHTMHCDAKYIEVDDEFLIKYENDCYIDFDNIKSKTIHLVFDDVSSPSKRIGVKFEDSDFFPPFYHFCFYSEKYDENANFILDNPGKSEERVYVKKDFIMPSLNTNEVDEVWISLAASEENHIKDMKIVKKIVECAKSNSEIGLDKDIYDYLKENSWDNHCIYLKYEGYPLVEEFFITETEDGRYIIDQYTDEEYDTIYWNASAYQF